MDSNNKVVLLECTTSIVSAYVTNNRIQKESLAALISNTFNSLAQADRAEAAVAELKPAVPVKRSVRPDHIVCLEDGMKFKSLKRHLMSHHNMTPQDYREKWGLLADYPMVAPDYAQARSELARKMGLGRREKPVAAAEPAKTKVAAGKKAHADEFGVPDKARAPKKSASKKTVAAAAT